MQISNYNKIFLGYIDDMRNELELLSSTLMPFGKHAGVPLIDLPEPYVVWFHTKGFPEGKLGELLGLLYEIKLNGLEHLVYNLREEAGKNL